MAMSCPRCKARMKVTKTFNESPETTLRMLVCPKCKHRRGSCEVLLDPGAIAWANRDLVRREGYTEIEFF